MQTKISCRLRMHGIIITNLIGFARLHGPLADVEAPFTGARSYPKPTRAGY
jgi:hypothetical protein